MLITDESIETEKFKTESTLLQQLSEVQFDGLSLNEIEEMEESGKKPRRPSTEFEQFPEPSIQSINVVLRRNPTTGLGINIVGGVDLCHIPGHQGIFISKIRANSPASQNGQLKVGDRILMVNGIYLSDKTHDEAVTIFRNIEKDCHLVVEPDCERILLSQPSNLIIAHSPTNTARSRGSKAGSKVGSRVGSKANSPTSSKDVSIDESLFDLSGKSNDDLVKKLAPKMHTAKEVKENKKPNGDLNSLPPFQEPAKQNEKLSTTPHSMPTIEAKHAQPTVAPAASEPSLHLNKVDDVPKTPKKATGALDSNSLWMEFAFVGLGVIGIGVGIYAFTRWYRRR